MMALLVPRLAIDRNVVDIGSYAIFAQSLEQGVALFGCYMVYIQVKGTAPLRTEITGQTFGGQCFKVTMGNFATLGDPGFKIAHLT